MSWCVFFIFCGVISIGIVAVLQMYFRLNLRMKDFFDKVKIILTLRKLVLRFFIFFYCFFSHHYVLFGLCIIHMLSVCAFFSVVACCVVFICVWVSWFVFFSYRVAWSGVLLFYSKLYILFFFHHNLMEPPLFLLRQLISALLSLYLI